jgi:hypothetical protein
VPAATAALLGLTPREYLINEDITVLERTALTLVGLGLARFPTDSEGRSPYVPILSVAGLLGPVITTAELLDVFADFLGGVLNGDFAPKTRVIAAGFGLTGGGDLTADRTLAVNFGTSSGTAAAGNDSRILNAVAKTRQVIAGTGLTGGGALDADRTLSVVFGTTAGTVVQGNDARLTGGSVNDGLLVHLAGAETLTGQKTFNVSPLVPTPTSSGHAATKAYVDANIGGGGGGGADIIHITGLNADGVTDDAENIQTVLDDLEAGTSAHSREVWVEAPPGASVYINATVQVESDYTTLRFLAPVVYGPNGRVRIQGEVAETPTTGKPNLTVDAAEGTYSMTLTSVAIFAVGNQVLIRGARDATGNVFKDQKELHTIASIAGTTLTFTEPLLDDYKVVNANPGAPAGTSHDTAVTKVLSSVLTVAAVRGDRTVTVTDTTLFPAGSYVQITDDTHTVKPDGSLELGNYKHREVAEVKQVISGTQLLLSHALHHSYDLTTLARVVLLNPVKHSAIRDASVTWSAMSVVGNAFEINTGVHCEITGCKIAGDGARTKSWKSQAFRQTNSYFCKVERCYATNPAVTDSGTGYGATFYGSTYCQVRDSYFSSLRHSVLFFNGAAGCTATGCVSEDCAISDYDLHGADCVDNVVDNCMAIGGDSAASDGTVNKTAFKIGNTTHTDGDHHNVISNCLAVNYRGSVIELIPTSSDNTFRNIRANGALTGIKLVALSANTALQIVDNHFINCDFADVATATNINGNASTSMLRGVTIEGCRFHRSTTGLVIQNAQRVRIRRNTWIDPAGTSGTYAVNCTNVTGLHVKDNDWSGFPRGVKLTTCPSARVTRNTGHDQTETAAFEDAGGNTGLLVRDNDFYGFAPTIVVSGTGPSTGGVVDLGRPYTPDTPAQHGWLEWNYDPVATGSATGQAATTGTLYLCKVTPRAGGPVSNVILATGSGSLSGTLTSGQNLIALFDSTGTRIATTSDQSSNWAVSSGVKTMAFTSPVALQAGRDYYVAILSNASTSNSALFVRTNSGTVGTANGALSSAAYRFAVNGTGLTAIPTTLTLSSNSGTNAQPWWVALS